jgi:hypothetical protein
LTGMPLMLNEFSVGTAARGTPGFVRANLGPLLR